MLYLLVVLSVLCGACSTEGIYYVRPADVSTCPGQPCHNLSYYSENSHLFFTSNTTLYFLPGEHILGHVIVRLVSNITLVGIVSAEHTILQCPGEGGIAFINCEKIYMLHLTFSNCGADYGTSMYRGVNFQCVTDVEISDIVVRNTTGFGLYALNVVGSVHIQNSVFTYNTGNIGGNAAFWYDETMGCSQVIDTLLHVENSIFAFGEVWSAELFSGGITVVASQSSYNIEMLVINTTLHGNQVLSSGGNMLIGIIDNSKGGCNLISVSIEHCNITQGRALTGAGGGLYVYVQHSNTIGREPHQCDAREPQYTLRITVVNFVNNTASIVGGNIFILDDSSVCNDISITNSSILGGQANTAGGMCVRMEAPAHDCMESKCNDSEYCNITTTRISKKRWIIWNCDIKNNIAAGSGGGLVITISGFNYLALQSSHIISLLVANTTLCGNKATSGRGGNVWIYYDSKGPCNLISVSIEHCYITQGEALNGGGLYVGQITTGDEPYQCDTGEPQHTLHITDIHFVNNTAHFGGGNIYVFDDNSVCNQINISNSSIIGGHAEVGGGIYLQMGTAQKMGHTERAWNDCDHCNTKLSEKRWTIWNSTIRNNFATASGGIMVGILEFNYSAQVDFIDVRFIENTATSGSNGHVTIHDFLGSRGGMVFIRFLKVYFGYGTSALHVSTYSADVISVRQVELWRCTFEENTPLAYSIRLYSFNAFTANSASRAIFRNVTFINTPIQVIRFHNVTFINSTFCGSSTHSSLSAIASEIRFEGNILFMNNTGYDGGALALFGGSKMILMPQTVVHFNGNHATHAGGAVMVYDESLYFTDQHCFYNIYTIIYTI